MDTIKISLRGRQVYFWLPIFKRMTPARNSSTQTDAAQRCPSRRHGNLASQSGSPTVKTILLTSLALLLFVQSVSAFAKRADGRRAQKGTLESRETALGDPNPRRLGKMTSPREARKEERTSRRPSPRDGRRSRRTRSRGKTRSGTRFRRSSNDELRAELNELRQEVEELRSSYQSTIEEYSRLLDSNRVGVHLRYRLSDRSNLFHIDRQHRYFIWSFGQDRAGRSLFNYSRAPGFGRRHGIYGVEVKYPGQYLLYSQVVVNGREDEIDPIFHCAHETVLVRQRAMQVLLRSYITQTNMGVPAPNSRYDNLPLRPKDTSFQMGLFVLERGDEIRIRTMANCGHFFYSADERGSYFGLVRL